MTNQAALPRDPHDFGWLVDNFAASTPGVMHALIVSADGLPLIAAGGMSPDLADPLARRHWHRDHCVFHERRIDPCDRDRLRQAI